MASIRTETFIDAHPDEVWDALREFGALHERLAPGFVTDCRLDGSDRIVTFFNGVTVTERLIDRDDDARRLAWTIVDGPYTHHNGVAQVRADGNGTAFVWVSDVLPHEIAPRTREMMEHGIEVIRRTLSGSTEAASGSRP